MMANQVKKQTEKAKADTSKQTAKAISNDQANSVDAQAAVTTTKEASLTPAAQAVDATGNGQDSTTTTVADKKGEGLADVGQAAVVTSSDSAEATQSTSLQPTKQLVLAKALKVIAKADKFRRGGHVFDRTETTLLLADLTDEQIKQIKDELLLVVTEVEIEVKAEVEAE